MAIQTRMTLLARVKDGDEISWNEFYNLYKPIVIMMGKDYQLNPQECEELVQDVMIDFCKARKNFTYNPSIGSFRAYFRTIVRSRIFKCLKKKQKHESTIDPSIIVNTVDAESCEQFVNEAPSDNEERQWQEFLLSAALQELQNTVDPVQIQIYIFCRQQQQNVADVAKMFNLSPKTIYKYIANIDRLIKGIVSKME